MKKITKKKRSTTKAKKKLNFWLPLVIVISFISLSLYLGYRSLVVTPSINLADGLDPEEAAFLQKKISQDKKTTTGVAPAPVVKVTVKDKDTGKEYTGKVILKNIDNPDNTDVTSLATAITQTVVENNTGIKPSPLADPDAPPPLPVGQSCSTVATGQWAQTGIKYQADGSTVCKTGEVCAGLRECVQCRDGAYDLSNKQVCGQGQALLYLTQPEEGKNAPCWENGRQYADSSSFAGLGKCQNGKWVSVPAPTATPLSDDLEQIEQDFLAESRRKDELHITPSIAPVIKPPTQTPNIPDPQSPDDRSSVSAPALASDTGYYSSRTNCEQGIDNTKEQCDILPGGGYGRVPLVISQEPAFNPFNFGSANSGSEPTTLAVGETCSYGIFGWGGTCDECPGGQSHVEKTAAFQARRVCGEEQPQTTPQIASNNDTADESTPSCGFFDRNSCGEGSTCEFNWAGINSKWECQPQSTPDVAATGTNLSNNSPQSNSPSSPGNNTNIMSYGDEPLLQDQTSGGTIYFSQNDPRWDNEVTFDCGDGIEVPFYKKGCGQTATAMLIATYCDSTVTPKSVKEDFFSDAAYCSGSSVSAQKDVLSQTCFEVGTPSMSEVNLKKKVLEGCVLYTEQRCSDQGSDFDHLVFADDVDEKGNFVYQDSWFGPNSTLEGKCTMKPGYAIISPPGSNCDPTTI